MPILVIPGAFTRASSFVRFADRIGAQVVDLPRPRIAQLDIGGLESIGRAVQSAIDHAPRDGTPLVLIGHSMGGLLSYRASLSRDIDGLILLMPAPPDGLVTDMMRLAVRDPLTAFKFALTGVSTFPARTGWIAPPRGLFTAGASPDDLRAASVHRADESMLALLQLLVGSRAPVERTTVPTLVIGGTQDGLIPPERVRKLAGALGADHLEFDVAHNFSEEPKGVVVDEAVEMWLRGENLL